MVLVKEIPSMRPEPKEWMARSVNWRPRPV